jgi:hypothetical protein
MEPDDDMDYGMDHDGLNFDEVDDFLYEQGYDLPLDIDDFQFPEEEEGREGEEGGEDPFNSKLKINFLKLSDYRDNDDEWKELVESVIGYVQFGCMKRTESDSLLLIVYNDIYYKIKSNPKPDLYYEHVSFENIPFDERLFIIQQIPFLREEEEEEEEYKEGLVRIFKYLKKLQRKDNGNYYFHFTCSEFEDSIYQQGLLVDPPIRIIDYEDEDDDDDDILGGKKKSDKKKSYKKKSYKKKSYKKKSYKKKSDKKKSYKKKSYKKKSDKKKSYKKKSYKNTIINKSLLKHRLCITH